MSARIILMSAASVALLAACSTSTNNPNYQYSTKYKGSNPYTTLASNRTTQVQAVPVSYAAQSASYTAAAPTAQTPRYATYTRVDELCLQGGAPVPCYPQEFTTTQTQAVVHSPYQTEPTILMAGTETTPQYYDYDNSVGTPGYHAVQSAQTSAETSYAYPETIVETVAAPSANVIQTYAGTTYQPVQTRVLNGGSAHIVVEGDTVYSFARQLCTSLGDIQYMNGIDGNFNIRVGDTIQLPASRC